MEDCISSSISNIGKAAREARAEPLSLPLPLPFSTIASMNLWDGDDDDSDSRDDDDHDDHDDHDCAKRSPDPDVNVRLPLLVVRGGA